jgi:hypothetical protein
MKELCVLVERWCVNSNTVRPNSSPGQNPAAPAAWLTEVCAGHEEVGSKERFQLFHASDYEDEPYPLRAALR